VNRGTDATRTPPLGIRAALLILAPFACGYFLSFFYRSVNAVIAPALVRELDLSASTIGLLTAIYFMSFAAFQLPLGLLLDRLGPRRVQSVLMLVAAAGALLFALGRSEAELILARAIIGLGASGALMSGMTTIVLWFPRDRVALLNAGFLVAGGFGGLAATWPLEALLGVTGWRELFVLLAVASAAVALLVFTLVPEHRRARPPAALRESIGQLRVIYADPAFWRLAAAVGLQVAGIFAIMGLWGGYWLSDVERAPRARVVDLLLGMTLSFTLGTIVIGVIGDGLARIGITTERTMSVGFVIFVAVELLLVFRVIESGFWLLIAIAAFGNLTALAFAFLPARFPEELAGRVLTALNIMTLGSSFLVQWLMGVIVDFWPRHADGTYPAVAYQAAFGTVAALHVVSTLVYFLPWRR
jgi:MFS family permease